MQALLSELKILIHIGQHLNIVNLLGAVTKNIRYGNYTFLFCFLWWGWGISNIYKVNVEKYFSEFLK